MDIYLELESKIDLLVDYVAANGQTAPSVVSCLIRTIVDEVVKPGFMDAAVIEYAIERSMGI